LLVGVLQLDGRAVHGLDAVFFTKGLIRAGQHVVDGIVVKKVLAIDALDNLARCFALAKAVQVYLRFVFIVGI
jgi:hypothetical protein